MKIAFCSTKYNKKNISYYTQPNNYRKIDNYISRSAQPTLENLKWLKQKGVTDVVNFRTMFEPAVDFNEQLEVEKLGMKYHFIPSVTAKPKKENVIKFLDIINKIKNDKGKAHIHCKAGADRTGMYFYVYKCMNNVDTPEKNLAEWLEMGHNKDLFKDLIPWTQKIVRELKKKR